MSNNPSMAAKSQVAKTTGTPNRSTSLAAHWKWLSLTVFAVAVLGGTIFAASNGFSVWSMGESSTEQEQDVASEVRRLPVKVAEAEFVRSISQKRNYTGILRARQKAALGFELAGRVNAVLCDEGDYVAQGQRLASLDVRSLEARRQATAATLRQSQAVLDELIAGPRREKIESLRAQVDEADSSLNLSRLNYDRRQELLKSRAISQEEFDRAKFGFMAAQAKLDSVRRQLEELEAGTRPERIAAQSAVVEQLKAAISEIDIQIEKSELVAPFAGKIVNRMIDPGTIADVSTPVISIVDVENVEAVIGIPVERVDAIDTGQVHEIVVEGVPCPAKLKAKIQQLESATRTQNLIFELDEYSSGRVIPGQLCQIAVETEIEVEGCWVPATALSGGIRGLWSLMTVNEQSSQVNRIDVEIVYTDGERVLVRGTISPGDLVIIDGTHRIVEGQFVEAVTDG